MFNADLATVITFGLIAQVILTVCVMVLVSRYNARAITKEVMKANKRLQDQISSRVG